MEQNEMKEEQRFLLDNKCDDLLLNERFARGRGAKYRIFVSDIMARFWKLQITATVDKSVVEIALKIKEYDFEAVCLDRDPDPGKCKVVAIDFEKQRAEVSNGAVRFRWPLNRLIITAKKKK